MILSSLLRMPGPKDDQKQNNFRSSVTRNRAVEEFDIAECTITPSHLAGSFCVYGDADFDKRTASCDPSLSVSSHHEMSNFTTTQTTQ